MIKIKMFFCVFFLAAAPFSVWSQEVSNKQILERLVQYEQINEQRFTLVLQQIKELREDMNRRFEQVDKRFEQVDKRFEQVDKRFDQVDKRFEFLQQIILALLAVTIGSPFLAEMLRRKRDQGEHEFIDESKRLIIAMRGASSRNEIIKEILQSAKLL